MRFMCTDSNKPTMGLHLEAHIRFQGTALVDIQLLFVIILYIEDYIKIDIGICTDIFKN